MVVRHIDRVQLIHTFKYPLLRILEFDHFFMSALKHVFKFEVILSFVKRRHVLGEDRAIGLLSRRLLDFWCHRSLVHRVLRLVIFHVLGHLDSKDGVSAELPWH